MIVSQIGLSGCIDLGESTTGELDAIEFSYSTNCIFDCPIDEPLMVGTVETLRLKGDAVTSDITVSSSAPEIAGFRLLADDSISRQVEMVTRGPGQVSLQVHRGSELLDQVTFSVREPRAIRLETGEGATLTEAKDISTKVGESTPAVTARVTDADGEELRADNGLVWSVDSGEIAVVRDWFAISSALQGGRTMLVEGVSPGQTALRVKAGETAGQSLSVKVAE